MNKYGAALLVAMHKTLIFLIPPGGEMEFLSQEAFVCLVRGDRVLPRLADCTVRVADWYMNFSDGGAARIDNESYSLLRFDCDGRVVWPAANRGPNAAAENQPPPERVWTPTLDERATMFRLADLPQHDY